MGLTSLFSRSGTPRRRPLSDDEIRAERLDPRLEREVLANAILQAWLGLAESFRPDEAAHEGQAFTHSSEPVAQGLAALPADQAPDGVLLRGMCSILGPALVERIQGLHERMDDLLDSHRSKDRELSTLKLSSSWLSDEMERCRSMIEQALRGREAMMPKPGPDGMKPLISDLLAVLLDVQKPTPPTQVHEGRRRDRTAADVVEPQRQQAATQAVPVTGPTDDLASLRRVLHEVLAGEASSGKLNRALGGSDLDLAKRLADLAAEHRTYRLTLRRIGLLPPE